MSKRRNRKTKEARRMDDAELSLKRQIEALGLDIPANADVNVATLGEPELMSRWNKVNQKLLDTGEILHPSSQAGRDLHSERAAYLIELHRRGLR